MWMPATERGQSERESSVAPEPPRLGGLTRCLLLLLAIACMPACADPVANQLDHAPRYAPLDLALEQDAGTLEASIDPAEGGGFGGGASSATSSTGGSGGEPSGTAGSTGGFGGEASSTGTTGGFGGEASSATSTGGSGEPPVPPSWTCLPDFYDASDGCDCGCGVPDPDCSGAGCSDAGCSATSCETCFDTVGIVFDCADPEPPGEPPCDCCQLPADPGPQGWTCLGSEYGSGDGCDCGCSLEDPDCEGSGCTEPGCMALECWSCHDATGRFACGPEPVEYPEPIVPAGWTCAPDSYGALDGCHCGCGVSDPDCEQDGCAEPSCWFWICDRCHDGAGAEVYCSLAEAAPAEWTCEAACFGSGDGCDCGCGIDDPDCGVAGCAASGCASDACDFCHDGDGVASCVSAPPPPPEEWACDADFFGTGDGCDCGCGAVDPDCDDGCAAPGCDEPSCAYCYQADGTFLLCADVPAAPPDWWCAPEHFGSGDGCDCGCGEIDPDCMASCPPPPVAPPGWTCSPNYYAAADGCDCGCGLADPDCEDGGCTDPGCLDEMCSYCYDASGDVAACAEES